jgi:S1-C subfamily serine protease
LWFLCGLSLAQVPALERAAWRETVERVSHAVVSIRMDRPRAFEGVGRNNSQATGFVIDAEQGLILTNRHVVTAGPIVARAVFTNQEEVDLVPVYRDPIHDFGIFRYDPQKVRNTRPLALSLRPDRAEVGVEIRVVGNDSGERLSILDGTIARLDRTAPQYGGGYSDYDTFYIQAASSTSGGSSGAPVVDIEGYVLAMNAGGKTQAATSFYLPLDRVVRAIELVRAGHPVPRGTLQTRMEYTPFSEVRRLGLSPQTEALARQARTDGTGMLVVREVLPQGPADGALEPGDVLVEIAGRPVLEFVTLEAMLDDHVGQELAVRVERHGQPVELQLTVEDLHALVPSRLLEVGGATLHGVSIHQARASGLPVQGVYVADPGRMFSALGEGAVLVEADGAPLQRLQDLEAVLAARGDRETLAVRWFTLSRPQQPVESAVRMDRRWFGARTCDRDDVSGSWTCQDLPGPEVIEPVRPVALEVPWVPVRQRRGRQVQPSLVGVQVDVPVPIAGLSRSAFAGGGLVVDAERGLVVVDRDTVPVALGDVRLLVAGAFEVPARVVALHEVHNLALVAYDPAHLSTVEVQSVRFARRPLREGDKAWYVGMEADAAINVAEVQVTQVEPFGLASGGPPRFRETNLDVVELREAPPSANGVLVRRGCVGAFWAAFSYSDGQQTRITWRAIPSEVVQEMLELADGGAALRTAAWELSVVPLPRAAERGLPPHVAEALVAHDPERRYVLQVDRIERDDPLAQVVQPGDLLVELEGEPVTRFREVEERMRGKNRVSVTVCRDGGLVEAEILPRPLASTDVERVVAWAGVRLHTPDRSARLLGVPPRRPYISWLESGSPAGRAGLRAQRTVTAVDGVDTPDLDTFVRAVGAAGQSVRLDLVSRTGEREVVTVEPDEAFFPTEEYVWVAGRWERHPL